MAWKKKVCNEPGCSLPVWSKKKCRVHQPPKEKPIRYEGMLDMFEEVWQEREHICYSCDCSLGSEPKTIFFHHILPKGKEEYKHLYNNKENIVLLCLDCHSNVNNIEKIKTLYNVTKKRIFDK